MQCLHCQTNLIDGAGYCHKCGATATWKNKRKKYAIEGGKGKAVAGDEFRCPKKGELYLSGAVPMVYIARNDLSTKYRIADQVIS